MIPPPEAHPLVQTLALHVTNPTYQRFSTLLVGGTLEVESATGAGTTVIARVPVAEPTPPGASF